MIWFWGIHNPFIGISNETMKPKPTVMTCSLIQIPNWELFWVGGFTAHPIIWGCRTTVIIIIMINLIIKTDDTCIIALLPSSLLKEAGSSSNNHTFFFYLKPYCHIHWILFKLLNWFLPDNGGRMKVSLGQVNISKYILFFWTYLNIFVKTLWTILTQIFV